MPRSDSLVEQNKIRQYYARLGLEPDAPMRDVEAAYWRFARELKGQAAMAPYNEAYEALVTSVKPRANEAEPAPSEPQPAEPEEEIQAEHPASKFGWPANDVHTS
jgi:hypothetical protein